MHESKYAKSYSHTQARNIRYLFIVDSKIDIEDFLWLFYNNQGLWGGRFNPVLPSYNGDITKEYIDLGKQFDPDIIVYLKGYDIEKIRHHFTTSKFEEAYSFRDFQLRGLSITYLLNLEEENHTILYENYLYKSLPNLHDFYKLNFGFLDWESNEVTRKFDEKIISHDNQGKLNEILSFGNPIYISTLSRSNVKRPILDSKVNVDKIFELIISDDENQFEDLIYFWNRALFSKYEPYSLLHIFISRNQLTELLKSSKPDNAFFTAITHATPDRKINIVSHSINEPELKKMKDLLNQWDGIDLFKVSRVIAFPFKYDDFGEENSNYNELIVKQSLNGREDFVHLPDLSFYHSSKNYGEWAVDILLERTEDIYQNKILLPCYKFLDSMFCNAINGRINAKHQISQFVNYETKSLDFTIPTDEQIFRHALLREEFDEVKLIERVDTSDAGVRLSALFKLFQYDFSMMEYFFQHEYWLKIFSGVSFNKKENRLKHARGIVCYKDLLFEYRNYYEAKFSEIDEKIMNENLKSDLKDLVQSGAYFIGNKIKCGNCGSSIWYGLPELGYKFDCKGCMNTITVPIESEVYYKLNDVIKNNLISNSGTKKNTHGNYTVLNTLFALKLASEESFYFLPCQNYYKPLAKTPASDIDIICMSDGKLIIGEAKNSYSEFNNKEIDNLVFLGDVIKPDKIILAYNEGESGKLDGHVKKIKAKLKNKSIDVEAYKIQNPFF